MQSEVLDERKRPAGHERVRCALPADIGIDPVNRRSREDGWEVPVGESCVLESGVHELQLARARKSLLGKPRQLSARLDRRDAEAPSQKAAGQLSSPATDLEHLVAALEAGEEAGEIDQLLGVGWAVAVVLDRHLIEDFAVAALECSVRHAHKVGDAADGALVPALRDQLGYSSLRHVRGSSGPGFGVRSSRNEW